MFTSKYFNPRYWATRYWPKIGSVAPPSIPVGTGILKGGDGSIKTISSGGSLGAIGRGSSSRGK